MDKRAQITSLLKEAGIYKSQGLLDQSKEKILEILEIIDGDSDLSSDENLKVSVNKKLSDIDESIEDVESGSDSTELSEDTQNLISKLFSFSKNQDTAAIESAMALAQFGQYEKAIDEFKKLLENDVLPLTVAKNMLQCHLSLASSEAAISQFAEWVEEKTFSDSELLKLRDYLENILEREGIFADLPVVSSSSLVEGIVSEIVGEGGESFEEDVSEILSIKIIYEDGPYKDQAEDYEIIYQLGNSVTFDINEREKHLIDYLEPGVHLPNIQCYTSFFFFNAGGTVSEKKSISSGPKKGSYSIVLELKNP